MLIIFGCVQPATIEMVKYSKPHLLILSLNYLQQVYLFVVFLLKIEFYSVNTASEKCCKISIW